MKPHTTHFDDCGCLTARLAAAQAEAAGLRGAITDPQKIAAILVQVRLAYAPEMVDDDQGPFLTEHDALEMARAVVRSIAQRDGDRSALRAIVVASVNATVDHFGEDNLEIPCLATERGTGCLGRTQAEVAACYARDREQLLDAIVARIMGEGEGA